MKVEIDDAVKYGADNALQVRIPNPGAFVFHKGLVFPLRKEHAKKEKDLYYIFGVIINDKLRHQVIEEIETLSTIYSPWYKTFIKNLLNNFEDIESSGVLSILNQKPTNQFENYNNEQFKNYVFFTFQDFLSKLHH